MMIATKIENVCPEKVDALGWQILRGYVYELIAKDESAWDCSREIELEGGEIHVEPMRFGYHGDDAPPCGADYLYADDGGGEFLVISSESDPANIPTVDGFELRPVTLEDGDYRHDGVWQFRVLAVSRDGETTLAGRS